jgi:hypothetical protein
MGRSVRTLQAWEQGVNVPQVTRLETDTTERSLAVRPRTSRASNAKKSRYPQRVAANLFQGYASALSRIWAR